MGILVSLCERSDELQPRETFTMSDNIGQALAFIASANQELRKQRTEEAVIQFCKAYALEPCLVKDHLVTLPQNPLQTVLCTLEDWCICGGDSAHLLLNSGVTLTLEQICDLITSPGLRPDSRVAWSTKLRLQMRSKSYMEAITTCSEAVKVFSNHSNVVFFLVHRAMVYLLLNEKGYAVNDFIAACDKDFDAGLACIKETGVKLFPAILEALYEAIARLAKKSISFSVDERFLLIKIDRIVVGLNPEDSATLGDCASHMIKLNQFKEAVVLLSDGIDHVTSSGKKERAEAVELILQRAQCYLALKETESALNDYLCAAAIDEDVTQITILASPHQHQNSIAALSKQLSSELLTHYRLKVKLNSACSVDTKITADSLDRAAQMYRLLYLMDSNNVDALVNAAECLKLQDKDADAIKTLDLVLTLRPLCSKAYYTRAFCHMKTADMTNALADFNMTLDIQPSFVQALCGRAFVWLMSGKLEKAAKDLTAASGISVGATVTWITDLSDCEQETMKNQIKEYLVTASKKRQQNEDSRKEASLVPLGDILTRAFATDFECHLVFAEILQSLCKMDEAQAILVRLITHNPDDYLATLHLAALKMRRKRTADALEDICALLKTIGEEKLSSAMLRLTDDDRVRLTREAHCEGVQRFNTRSGDASIEGYFSVAIAASPNKAFESYVWRAKLKALKGETDLAIKDLTSVLAKKPNHVEVLCQRGLLFTLKNNRKASYQDLLQALLLNTQALKIFILSLPEDRKRLILATLEDCAQTLFSHYLSRGIRSKFILKLCHLLVQIGGDVVSYHSMYADGLIIFEDYRRAAEELDITERLCPEDVSVLSRSGLVHIKLNEVETSASKFQKVAKIDSEAVNFALKALNPAQKQSLFQEAVEKANQHTNLNQNDHALGFFSLSVAASDGQRLEILRMRSKCFERLRRFQEAIEDMTSVISSGIPIVGDLVARGNLHLLNDNFNDACLDFVVAMDTQEVTAMTLISSYPGREAAIKVFIKAAISNLNHKKFSDGLTVCTYGLKFDPNNIELKTLKRKFELGVSNKCFIQ